MPKKYGVKEKDLVVAHIVNLVLTGKLRSGDRLDRNEIAQQLGLSRVPVQEAVVQLEHDGVLSTRYHRGAFVERFDERTVLENHEVNGALTAIASARAAAGRTEKFLHDLERQLGVLRGSAETRTFHENAWRYRQLVNETYAGPRLQAAIRASQLFMPNGYWTAYLGSHDEIIPFYEAETDAIANHDAEGARAACLDRSLVLGRIMLNELVRRRVLGPNARAEEPHFPAE